MSNSIKRYVSASFGRNFESSDIFRAIKVTDNNHKTILDFAGSDVSVYNVETKNKSRQAIVEKVRCRTLRGHRTCKNGEYIYRTTDGKFRVMESFAFERLFRETSKRIVP